MTSKEWMDRFAQELYAQALRDRIGGSDTNGGSFENPTETVEILSVPFAPGQIPGKYVITGVTEPVEEEAEMTEPEFEAESQRLFDLILNPGLPLEQVTEAAKEWVRLYRDRQGYEWLGEALDRQEER